MPHNVASDQGLQCMLTGFSIKDRTKATSRPSTSRMTNGLVQHIIVEESTIIQWVNSDSSSCYDLYGESSLVQLNKYKYVEAV